jgi:hypothetical protein
MMKPLREWLKTSYTRLLEEQCAELKEEIGRLRAENRALVNSLLVRGGVAPIQDDAPKTVPTTRRRSWHQMQALVEQRSTRKVWDRERRDGEVESEIPEETSGTSTAA